MQIGDKCPSFELNNQQGELVHSSSFIGKQKAVIFFYPKDETPGCTKEACSFRDKYEDFLELGCQVIGISSDSVDSHAQFANRFGFTFTLLSDPEKSVRKAFQVPGNLFGLLPGRVTYIVDASGIIRGIFNSQLNPLGHVTEALKIVSSI
jgi:peroxiredoxin Q/BCP